MPTASSETRNLSRTFTVKRVSFLSSIRSGNPSPAFPSSLCLLMPRGKRKATDDLDYAYAHGHKAGYDPYASSSAAATSSGSRLLAALEGTQQQSKAKGKRKAKNIIQPSCDGLTQEKPSVKRQKKSKNLDAPAPEKRGAIFKKKCPQNILERVDRVISQRCSTFS